VRQAGAGWEALASIRGEERGGVGSFLGRYRRLSCRYSWDRTRFDSTDGAKIRVGHGVLAHNLVKFSVLAA